MLLTKHYSPLAFPSNRVHKPVPVLLAWEIRPALQTESSSTKGVTNVQPC